MHCLACDKLLSEAEDARVFAESGARVSLCNRCVIWVPNDLLAGGELDWEDDDIDQEGEPLEDEEDADDLSTEV